MLSNGLWVSALGAPQAILVSKDMITWYPLHIESFNKQFNHQMMISEGSDYITCSTGESLLLIEKNKLYEVIHRGKPCKIPYGAYIDKLKGLGFTIKRRLMGI